MGRYKFLILKTAAVALTVSVLIMTGCQGGNDEAAAVKNKGTVRETSVVSEKGESVDDIQGDGKENIEAVVRSNGVERTDTQAESDDSEREESEDGREPKVTSEAKPSEDGDSVLTEEDRGTDDGSTPVGTGEGSEDDSAVSESISVVAEVDGEYTDYTDEWYEPDTAGVEETEGSEPAEPEYEQSYDESDEYYNSGVDESGYSDGAGDNLIYLDIWTISFYCSCTECTGSGNGITASGTYAQPWHTAATDGLEFGTTLYVEGLGYFVVEDRGTSYGWLDVYTGDHNEALALGLQSRAVYLVN